MLSEAHTKKYLTSIVRGFTQVENRNTAVLPRNNRLWWLRGHDGDLSKTLALDITSHHILYTMQKAQQQAHLVVLEVIQALQTVQYFPNPTETGGSGYKVGDRLRLVGGTPVADPMAAYRNLYYKSGAGYVNGHLM